MVVSTYFQETIMRMSAIFSLAFILTGTAEIWVHKKHESEWSFQTVRKRVDPSIVIESVDSQTLTGCASFCSNLASTIERSLYYIPDTKQCACNAGIDGTSEDENEVEVVYGTRKSVTQIEIDENLHKRTTVWPYKQDCFGLLKDYRYDGVFVILPQGGGVTDTWCDMTNGGWTVIQRRMDGSEDFYRGWNEYVTGFGNRTGEYWLGLDNIHLLTQSGSELVVHMEAFSGVTPPSMAAHYSNFKVGDAVSKYTIDITGFSGTCGNAFSFHNGQAFSTFDNDNDNSHSGEWSNCAERFKCAWWHAACYTVSLNGLYFKEGVYDHLDQRLWATGIHWYECWDRQQSSKAAVMKIQRKI